MVKHYFIAGIIGAVITFLALQTCNPTAKPEIVTETRIDTVFETVSIPTIQGEAKAALKYTYGGMLHDTITERVYITTANNDTVSSFTSILDTIQNKDTLHLEYTYPDAMFRYQLNRSPIEVKTVNTTITNTVAIEPSKFSFGVQFGVGYLVSWRTGQSALGSYFGIGCNYKL